MAKQAASAQFYRKVLQREPVLDVPGMTEFLLAGGARLGLMTTTGIAKIIGNSLPHPEQGQGIPRCELYLPVPDPDAALQRALAAGGTAVSAGAERSWGDYVAYAADPDGHVLAFACRNS